MAATAVEFAGFHLLTSMSPTHFFWPQKLDFACFLAVTITTGKLYATTVLRGLAKVYQSLQTPSFSTAIITTGLLYAATVQ